MGILDGLKRKLRKNKETETPERTKDAITTSTEKPKNQKNRYHKTTFRSKTPLTSKTTSIRKSRKSENP